MKPITLLILLLGYFAAQAATLKNPHSVPIYLPISKQKMTMLLSDSTRNFDPEKSSFQGIEACPQATLAAIKVEKMTQCLEFHTHFSAQPLVYVPVVEISPFNAETAKANLVDLYKGTQMQVQPSEKKDFAWGYSEFWSTQSLGSSVYIFIAPKGKNFAVRIGPFAGLVMADYDLNLNSLRWTSGN